MDLTEEQVRLNDEAKYQSGLESAKEREELDFSKKNLSRSNAYKGLSGLEKEVSGGRRSTRRRHRKSRKSRKSKKSRKSRRSKKY